MLRELQEIQNLATKYSKADLGRMVQLGLIDPQKAMMAGMMIQRIQQQNAQPPQTTVAQDVLGMPPVPNQPPQQAPQGQMPPMQGSVPPQMEQQAPGIEALPAGNVGNYADGGIVAFADKGLVEQGGRMSSSGEYVPPEYVIHSAIEESKKPKTDKYDPKSGNLLSNTGTGTGDPTQKGTDKTSKGKRQPKLPGRWEGTYATKYDDIIEEAANKYGVDPKSMWRLLYTESAFNPKATSYAGKRAGYGVAQISHHHKLTDAQMEDPKFAINYATKYFAGLLKKSGGDYRTALEKYKGVVTEDGRRRMASAIDKVLGSDPVYAPTVKPSKLTKLAPGETPTYPVPSPQVEVTRQKGKPTTQELIEQYKAIQAQSQPPAPPVKPVGQPLNMTEEYNRDAGGWFYPEDLVNHPEFFSNYARGGIISLSHGGIPHYAGQGPSQTVTDPNGGRGIFSEGFKFPSGSLFGMFQSGSLPWQGSQSMPWQETDAMRLNRELQNIERQLQDPKISPNRRRELEIGRNVLIQQASALYPSEGARGSATFTRPDLPPIASPSSQQPAAPEADATEAAKPGSYANPKTSLAPVEVTEKRIVDEPEEKAAKVEQPKEVQPARRGFGLPPFDKYKIDLPVYTGDMPERTSVEAEREKRVAHEKAVGYNPEELYNSMISKIEDQKGDYATEKDRAIGQAIMMAGFKLMGARRGQEFQNLSEGAQEGLKSYQQSMKEFMARKDKLDERADAYKLAKAQALRSGAESDINRFQKQEEMYYKAQEDFAKAKNEAAYRGAYLSLGLRDQEKALVIQAMADRAAKERTQMQVEGKDSATDVVMEEYNRILKTEGKEAAENYLELRNRIQGGAKAQSAIATIADKARDNVSKDMEKNMFLQKEYKDPAKFNAAVEAEMKRLMRAYNYGGGQSGTLQKGADGTLNYVPSKP